MKELARITLALPADQQYLQQRLEEALSGEVAILKTQNLVDALPLAYKSAQNTVHHNVLAQPQFQFLPRALKAQELATNVQL